MIRGIGSLIGIVRNSHGRRKYSQILLGRSDKWRWTMDSNEHYTFVCMGKKHMTSCSCSVIERTTLGDMLSTGWESIADLFIIFRGTFRGRRRKLIGLGIWLAVVWGPSLSVRQDKIILS
ncbi:hypothetical protein VNO77_19845 [Canavalia gladiata]|uniref:Uncharacterized protein n=1 Tax=Canavalia gladiata TaxID=3824 RepID=A0AAN9LND0_CANGL